MKDIRKDSSSPGFRQGVQLLGRGDWQSMGLAFDGGEGAFARLQDIVYKLPH